MDENEFESWFAPRLKTLDAPKHQLRLLAIGLLVFACLMGIAWLVLK